jgi:hypothetical protein
MLVVSQLVLIWLCHSLVRLCKVVSLVNTYYRQPSWSGLVPCAKGIGQLVLSCFTSEVSGRTFFRR